MQLGQHQTMNVQRDVAQNTTAVVLAGGKGTRLGPLTRHLCKPALPFGAGYRNIDFSLSNCVNSDIRRVGIATQHKPGALLRHIGEVWSPLARRSGEFIQAWPSKTRAPLTGYRGTADAVFRNLDLIERQRCGLVLVLAGDHVYQMDYRPMLAFHRSRQADVTVGCIEVPVGEASQFGILSLDAEARIDRFVEKPKTLAELPRQDRVLASMGIYVFEAKFLARVLRRDAALSTSSHDFGRDILPSLLRTANLYAYRFMKDNGTKPGYWRDVGTPAAYWRAHLELLDDTPNLNLDDPCWPLPSMSGAPAITVRHALPGAEIDRSRSLIARGCEVQGTVNRSVLCAHVRVAAGTRITRSVVLPGALVGRNCRISDAIVENDCHVPDGTVIDASWRGAVGGSPDQPVMVTADDFAPESIYVSA
jgi:glucose-1-phosphate adenylyltransferase